MAHTLKTFFSPALVRRLAADVVRVHPEFPATAFVRRACAELDAFELLDRARHIANTLAKYLPGSYPDAINVVLRSLGPEQTADEIVGGGMAPFFYLPHVLFVAGHGLEHFDLSMDAQYELTKRFSAEFSIRSFIARDPERALAFLGHWAKDRNPHVRRLVSEGTRLRLPWAPRVAWLDANPERILELLDALKDDASSMVRRSVANSLNDIGKSRRDLLIRTAATWRTDGSAQRHRLIEHALRHAVKKGDRDAIRLLGYGNRPRVSLESVTLDPRCVRIGGRVAMTFILRSTTRAQQDLLVDVAVHFVRARGLPAPKVFKVRRLVLAPAGQVRLKATFSLAVHTTRTPRPGRHAVDVIVNGRVLHAGSFRVA